MVIIRHTYSIQDLGDINKKKGSVYQVFKDFKFIIFYSSSKNNKNREIDKKTGILINFYISNNHNIQIIVKYKKIKVLKKIRYVIITKKEVFKCEVVKKKH